MASQICKATRSPDARRYGLLTLVGIAGKEDLDAPQRFRRRD
jgi:hypothetical protein